jgi:YVTN family beta-propeller protein
MRLLTPIPSACFSCLFAALLSVLWLSSTAGAQSSRVYLEAPAGERYAVRNPSGVSIIPSGRLIAPYGRTVTVAPHPYGVALSADGQTLVTANSGTGPFSISILTDLQSPEPKIAQIPPGQQNTKEGINAVFMGVAIAPDSRTIYASGGNDGVLYILDAQTKEKLGEISLDTMVDNVRYEDSFPGDLTLSPDGRLLYVVDNANFRLVIVDTQERRVVRSVRVGRYPYAVALSPDGQTAYVANIGVFEYSPIVPAGQTAEQAKAAGRDPRGISFPPFGLPSKEARDGVEFEGYRVPGLGDPNVPESFSVWAVDVSGSQPKVIAKIKTGVQMGQKGERYNAVGGSSPNALVVSNRFLFVSNGANDTVQMIDRKTHRIARTIRISPSPLVAKLKGVMPFGLALSPDGRRLYVCEAGLNAVGVIDVQSGRVLGHIPVGWFPSRLAVSQDGKRLYVANAKGFGSGPNGGANFQPGPEGRSIGRLMRGSVTIFDIPADSELPALTQRVLENNGIVNRFAQAAQRQPSPIPRGTGKPSEQIQYVVFIAKENRTFDEVFGAMPGVRGDPSLARFGAPRRIGEHENVVVMPNHIKLAQEFAFSDNFYTNSDHSADGHRWLVGVPPNIWVDTNVRASYGGRRSFKLHTTAPGRRAIFGSNSSLMPEDYWEDGAIWEHLLRFGIRFRNYGQGFELAGVEEGAGMKPTGARETVNIPMPKALWDNTSRDYPQYNMNIPDQYRADQFLKEFQTRFANDPKAMPRMIYMHLPNDHGDRPRPNDGYPYTESFMADNDYALGRIVEALSHSRYWPQMAIFVLEDDPQGGVDSVDAHRSVLLVISPYARRGYISRRHTDIMSVHKTVFSIFGLPPLNQFDALTSDLSDCFQMQPDLRPYKAVPVDERIFDPKKAKDPADPDYRQARLRRSIPLDDEEEGQRQQQP